MRPWVSVIVPVFNVENYLQQCLDSLLGQTLSQIEVIAVDDGSTDRSADILQQYASRDNRLMVIKQENQGQGGARNKGLALASGEYVGFVDPDDWVAEEMFEALYHKAKAHDADLCACDYTRVSRGGDTPNSLNLTDEILVIQDYGLERLWQQKRYSVVVWNKIYKKSLLDEHSIRFADRHEIFSEDVLFNLYYMRNIHVVATVPRSLYYYRHREGSTMASAKPDYLRKEMMLLQRFQEYYAPFENQETVDKILSNLLFDRVINSCMENFNEKKGLKNIHEILLLASKHEHFQRSMYEAWRNAELWLPLRGFAYLSFGRRLLLSSCYLYSYHKATRIKRYIRKYV